MEKTTESFDYSNQIKELNHKLSMMADGKHSALSKRSELACRFACAMATPNSANTSVMPLIAKGFQFADEFIKQGG